MASPLPSTFSSDQRHLLVLYGEEHDCLSHAKKLTAKLESLLLENPKKANDFLGQEFDAVIFNTFKIFDANAFGAISGTIRSGGYFILIRPASTTQAHQKKSLFLKRFDQLLENQPNTTFINATPRNLEESINALPNPPRKQHFSLYASSDQEIAVEKIIHVIHGHRRRPLVITSDRGRGKSAALGLAAAKLLADDENRNIIICAPSKKSADVVIKMADNHRLTFYSPDELYQQNPHADLLLIDEASAIPVSLLVHFLNQYSRIIFATTQHGYEGSGRGFSINFHKELDKKTPNWKHCQLKTPIRWNENDALEAFSFKALLLNAEPVDAPFIHHLQLKDCRFTSLNKQHLIQGKEEELHQLFGLLVSAHYQTKPSDLMNMLDDDAMTIYTLQYHQHIIAVVLLIREGEIEKNLAQAIFEGTRRIKGNLVAQSLAANAGIASAPMLKGQRVSRIAVHPSLQQRGFGSLLLKKVIDKTKADYVSTSFGATQNIISFWKRSNFTPVYLGMKRDASSGHHSVLMIYPKTKQGQELLEQTYQRFNQNFPLLLSEPFQRLEPNIALSLLNQKPLQLTYSEINELRAFATKQRGYENTLYSIWLLVAHTLGGGTTLSESEKRILLHKVLQKQSWKELVSRMNLSGKKEALRLLREAVKKLLEVQR